MSQRAYLIWSNQHRAWWGPNEVGYTTLFEAAGRYTYLQATEIVRQATAQGHLKRNRFNHITGQSIPSWDEVMVKIVDFDPKTGASNTHDT